MSILEENLKNTIFRHENTASDLLYSFFQYLNIFDLVNHLGGFYRFVYGDPIPNQVKSTCTPGPWLVRFLGQEILRTNQKRTNQVTDGL